ncbi:MAG TPA: SRPBCC domain-containing protein [Caulobacteraceae bacterium]|nr:SRPBCC domain-containing protein [Caulobacteraceae bacterium]
MADNAGYGRFIDEATVEYERIFPHPIERVWRAITAPAEIAHWFEPMAIDLRDAGGWSVGGAGGWTGAITALDPPKLVRFGHGPGMLGGEAGYFQYELQTVPGGTRMLFTQHFPDVPGGLAREPDGVAGGWHEIFDCLTEWLDDIPIGAHLSETRLAATVSTWAQGRVRAGEFDEPTARRYVLDLRREEAGGRLNNQYRQRAATGLGGQADGGLARFPDRWTVEYLRTYPHPIERVWRAITDPNEFGAWFIPGELEPRAGGAFHFKSGGWAGVVEAIDPPRYIRLSGGPDGAGSFEYELTPVEGGTRMRFAQRFDPAGVYAETPGDLGGDLPGGPGTPWKPGFVGGWHEFWDALGDHLDGVPVASRLPRTEFSRLVEDVVAEVVAEGAMTEANGRRFAVGFRRHERWNELNKIYRTYIPQALPPGPA